jgi:hypothetical protein
LLIINGKPHWKFWRNVFLLHVISSRLEFEAIICELLLIPSPAWSGGAGSGGVVGGGNTWKPVIPPPKRKCIDYQKWNYPVIMDLILINKCTVKIHQFRHYLTFNTWTTFLKKNIRYLKITFWLKFLGT